MDLTADMLIAAALAATVSLAAGCQSDATGCQSDEDCRAGRVCNAQGACVGWGLDAGGPAGDASTDNDTSTDNDVSADTPPTPDPEVGIDVGPPPDCDRTGCPRGDDGDGICRADNCPNTTNPDQKDSDGDGLGDKCDNCPRVVNAGQKDSNDDGTGDLCSGTSAPLDDPDGDGIEGIDDNCPETANPSQKNEDDDAYGDACDNCQARTNPTQEDSNGDGLGDACEPRPSGKTCHNALKNVASSTCTFTFGTKLQRAATTEIWVRLNQSWFSPTSYRFDASTGKLELLPSGCKQLKRVVAQNGGAELEVVVGCVAECDQQERCNGRDDDCDGQIDEEHCYRGAAEVCDGKDNDVDGKIDENCQCLPDGEACTSDEDCCGHVCSGGTCRTLGSKCIARGDCYLDSECCNGFCVGRSASCGPGVCGLE